MTFFCDRKYFSYKVSIVLIVAVIVRYLVTENEVMGPLRITLPNKVKMTRSRRSPERAAVLQA